MELIIETYPKNIIKPEIGAKAKNLFRLKELGFRVPAFVVIPVTAFLESIQDKNTTQINEIISSFVFPEFFFQKIISFFPADTLFAVRSSAEDEDGSGFSFAGQFESYLNIPKEKLEATIKKVWHSAFSERVLQYRKAHNLKETFNVSVIIQEMVKAEISGVAFSVNPATGERNVKVINAVYGLGEGLVSGTLNADSFFIKDEKITSEIVTKTHEVEIDFSNKKLIPVESSKQNVSTLDEKQILEICSSLDICEKEWGKPQDIEFAYAGDRLYLLQARPVTNLHEVADPNGEYILWDNSNIIESYPGVTTPLTFSFISKSYEGAYTLFCAFLGVNADVLKENKHVFANTLGLINGRVYYNIKSWYHMLAMLPGYSINARFMEKMMGVKEQFDIPENYRLPLGKAWWRIIKMAVKMYFRFLSLPRKRKEFVALLNTTIAEYKNIDLSGKNSNELMELYRDFETRLLNEWKAPLLNDFFAMIWFGSLEKKCKKYFGGQNTNIHNDLLCGSNDIISTEPIHRCMALAEIICASEKLKDIFNNNSETVIWEILHINPDYAKLKKEIDQYIYDFGERCVGELKLETVSYTQDPTKFIKQLQGYVASGITTLTTSGKVEADLRKNAEQEINRSLKYKPFEKWFLKRSIKKTRELVSARENLRYERTRAFGIVRELFSQIGKRFYAEGIIENSRDIFYLSKEEIFSFIEGTSITQNIKALIALRKEEYETYKNQSAPSDRFATYGTVYYANDFFSLKKTELTQGDLKGIGCSPGRVTGKVQIVLDPNEISSLNGDILVTSSTDPGWTILFPGCSGIIVERGSLLSHSAIVSREMGKPCIVSVSGLLKRLKTGDEIQMDGSTGEIRIIKSVDDILENKSI
jgi:phosphohistidine swiveling domain-containing protein